MATAPTRRPGTSSWRASSPTWSSRTPPYGVSYQDSSGAGIKGDDKRDDDLIKNLLVPALKHAADRTRGSAGFYVWHAEDTSDDFRYAITAAGLRRVETIIWAKPSAGIGMQGYRRSHEPCFYCSKDGEQPNFYGGRSEATVWRIEVSTGKSSAIALGPGLHVLDGSGRQIFLQPAKPRGHKGRKLRVEQGETIHVQVDDAAGTAWEVKRDGKYEHPTQKPVALAQRAIENSSQPLDTVLDPFGGSGSTLLAAEVTGRRCFILELDPKFCDVIVDRWEKLTGGKAKRFTREDRAKAPKAP